MSKAESQKRYRERHREEILESNRRYRECNRELIRKRHRRWTDEHREETRQRLRSFREVHRDRLNALKRERDRQDPSRVKARKLHERYGLTLTQFDQMVVAQEGKCAICKLVKKLVIDHCHNSGHVRGLLCDLCNRGIGYFHDNPSSLRAAAQYVER